MPAPNRAALAERLRARRARRTAEREALRDRESEERITTRLAHQWSEARAARVPAEPVIEVGPTNRSRAQVPYGVDLAAAWSWRFIVISVATLMILWTLRFFIVLVLPLIVALLISALMAPVINLMHRYRVPRKLAAGLIVIGGVASVGMLLTFVGQQVATGIGDLSTQVVQGLDQIQNWLKTGPLNVSDSQINEFIRTAQAEITQQGKNIGRHATEVGTTVGHVLAGFFIVLFATFFFLADGRVLWTWVVRLFPRDARVRADTSGQVAWRSLTQFVRATVLVAAVDAAGIAIWAAALGLPLVSAIGVLVFLGSFVPMIGATITGTVAVLVALVAKGPIAALIMLAGVIVVQQVEGHVLQPFLMGRFVAVHPLGVIISIAAGVLVAGIAGALIAVPLVAALNAVVQHLAAYTEVGESAEEAADRELVETDEPADVHDVEVQEP